MTTLAEQITALETKRASHVAAQTGVMQKSIDAGRSTEPSEQEEFDNLQADVEAIDKDLERFRKLEKTMAVTARPVVGIKDERGGVEVRSSIVVKGPPPMAPGINFARFIKCNWLASKHNRTPAYVAEMQYGADSEIAQTLTKAAVGAGSSLTGNWAYDLVSQEGGVAADFAAYLRPGTILGKFGTGGIPSLRDVPFRTPLIIQTGGGAGYWVGQGKPKPLTSFDFDRTTLDELKVANICVLTEESIRASSPKSDAIVRDQLKEALEARLDIDFIDPAKVAVAGVSPASITNGAPTIVSSGDDADAVRLDVRSLMAKFTSNNNPPSQGVWIMSVDNALALQMMVNTLGQPEFPGVSMSGGSFSGMPVIASNYVSKIVVLVNASDIFLADEGGVSVDMSREASLQMDNAPTTQDALTGTGIALVSMFQTNSVAIRAERIINWKRRRPSAVAYLTSADWGGNVHTA